MKLAVYEMLQNVAKETKRDNKKELLRKYVSENKVVGQILDFAFDPKIKFALPEGSPPFRKSEFPDTHGQLFTAARKLYLFIEGGRPDLSQLKREQLFIQFLEEIHPEDAEVIIRVKDKKSPYPGVTKRLVEETFGVNYDRNRPKQYKKPKETKNGQNDTKRSKQGKGKSQGSQKARNTSSKKTAKDAKGS